MSTATPEKPQAGKVREANRQGSPAKKKQVQARIRKRASGAPGSAKVRSINRTTSQRDGQLSKKRKAAAVKPVPIPAATTSEIEIDDGFRFTIAHAFILLSYLVGSTLLVTFGLDLIIKVPFQRASITYDVANVIGGLTLIYLSWNCQRDLQ
jgi:hypothetical protein